MSYTTRSDWFVEKTDCSGNFSIRKGWPKRICEECGEKPYDIVLNGVVEHYICNDCHKIYCNKNILRKLRQESELPEELFNI